ncbi:hypothetical protein [Streptomyces sp. NPDC059176]
MSLKARWTEPIKVGAAAVEGVEPAAVDPAAVAVAIGHPLAW